MPKAPKHGDNRPQARPPHGYATFCSRLNTYYMEKIRIKSNHPLVQPLEVSSSEDGLLTIAIVGGNSIIKYGTREGCLDAIKNALDRGDIDKAEHETIENIIRKNARPRGR